MGLDTSRNWTDLAQPSGPTRTRPIIFDGSAVSGDKYIPKREEIARVKFDDTLPDEVRAEVLAR